jgi:hypothetical protein
MRIDHGDIFVVTCLQLKGNQGDQGKSVQKAQGAVHLAFSTR